MKNKPNSLSFLNLLVKRLAQRKNLWIALALLLANGVAWVRAAATSNLAEVAPILHPGVGEMRAKWNDGSAVGQTFSVIVTDEEAGQTVAWFIEPRQHSLPFSRPHVAFKPGEISGRGLMTIAGLQVEVFGRGFVTLDNGRPIITVYEVGVGSANVPDFVKNALQSQVDRGQAVYDDLELPIELTRLDIGNGYAIIEGVYRERK